MIPFGQNGWAVESALLILALAILILMPRMAKGPSLADRVVILDLISMIMIGIALVCTVLFSEKTFLDVALAVALTSFLGTIGFAGYLQKRGEEWRI